jgi:protein tyrosine/serine phosphatase
LYRGAVPSNVALEELHAQGIKLVVDLREKGGDTLRERQEVTALGMHYVSVPLSPWSAPTPDQVRSVLSFFGNQPIFVHCRRGKDRTGTIIACYRIQHDGWSNTRALEEANHYGMSHMERAMRSFILRFSPAAIPVPSPYSPAPPPLTTQP